jgi:hypothetical protein
LARKEEGRNLGKRWMSRNGGRDKAEETSQDSSKG